MMGAVTFTNALRAGVMHALHMVGRSAFGFSSFGRGSVIKPWPRRIAGARYVSIGEECFFGDGLVLVASDSYAGERHTPRCTIGNRCAFGSDAFLSCTHEVTIGDDVLTSARVFIGDSYHGFSDPHRPIIRQPMEGGAPIVIGSGSFLGIGCSILPGVRLGRNCVVGAGAVVTRSFEDYSVIAGMPARLIRRYDPHSGSWMKT